MIQKIKIIRTQFVVGDRVRHTATGHRGTIAHIDAKVGYLHVVWDDGVSGLMYDEADMIPNIKYLAKEPQS